MHISGIEPSSVILSQTKKFQKLKSDVPKVCQSLNLCFILLSHLFPLQCEAVGRFQAFLVCCDCVTFHTVRIYIQCTVFTHTYIFTMLWTSMVGAASHAGDADFSRAHVLFSGFHVSMIVLHDTHLYCHNYMLLCKTNIYWNQKFSNSKPCWHLIYNKKSSNKNGLQTDCSSLSTC